LSISHLGNSFNSFNRIINERFVRNNKFIREHPTYSAEDFVLRLNYGPLMAVWDNKVGDATAKATAMVDYLDLYLNAGQLAQSQNTGTRAAMISNLAVASEAERYQLAAYAVATTPEFLIQR